MVRAVKLVEKKNWYSIREAAEVLGVARTTVWMKIRFGEVKASRRGTGGTAPFFIPSAELDRLRELYAVGAD